MLPQLAYLSQFANEAPLALLAMLAAAYVLGSVPTAVWVSRLVARKDIREMGSGNAGSTNTYRVLGFWPGMVVQVVDILKGVAAALIPYLAATVYAPLGALLPAAQLDGDFVAVQFLCGLAAVLGHVWPVLAGFRGGKGMNTLLGMMVVVFPWAALIAVGVFVAVLLLRHMVSLASMAAAWVLPVYVLYQYLRFQLQDGALLLAAVAVPLLVMYTHRSNIVRLRAGTESKVGFLQRKRGIHNS